MDDAGKEEAKTPDYEQPQDRTYDDEDKQHDIEKTTIEDQKDIERKRRK